MTVAVQTVIRFPLYSSLTPRYLSGFDNYWSFRHFPEINSGQAIGRFAFLPLRQTWRSSLLFTPDCFTQPFLLSLHASLLPPTHHRSGLTSAPKSPDRKACFHLYCSYVAFATHSTHRVDGWRPNDRQCASHTTVPRKTGQAVRFSYTAVCQAYQYRSLHQ